MEKIDKRILLVAAILILLLLIGCGGPVPPKPKFKLTLIFPDGTSKVFEGQSVERDNMSGEWSYTKIENGTIQRSYFKGQVVCEPILDLTAAPERPIAEATEPASFTQSQ